MKKTVNSLTDWSRERSATKLQTHKSRTVENCGVRFTATVKGVAVYEAHCLQDDKKNAPHMTNFHSGREVRQNGSRHCMQRRIMAVDISSILGGGSNRN